MKRLIGVGAIAIVIVAAGCSSSTSQPTPSSPSTREVTSPAVTPTASPAPSPVTVTTSVAPKPSFEAIPAALEPYKAMTAARFAAVAKSEQLSYWSWQARDLGKFADEYYQTTRDPRDRLVAASESNTAQEIAAIQAFKIRFIFSIEDDIEREKALIAVLYDGRSSEAYPFWKDVLKQAPSELLNIGLLAKNVTPTSDVMLAGPRGAEYHIKFQDIKHLDGSHLTRAFYVPYTDAVTGAQTATWIRQ